MKEACAGAQLKRLRRALKRDEVRVFTLAQAELEVPHADAMEGFGKTLAAAAAVLRATVVTKGLVEELRQNPPGDVPLDPYLAVAEETLQGLTPTVDLLNYTLRKSGVAQGAGKLRERSVVDVHDVRQAWRHVRGVKRG